MEQDYTYFQYHKGLNLPVYVRCDTTCHEMALPALLEVMKFQELTKEEGEKAALHHKARLLTIKLAGVRASRQIEDVLESDRFGRESVIPKAGYKVYRYKSLALMVYSYGAQEWECGVSSLFGMQDHYQESQVIINRYLSWALAPLGLIGFWGVPVDEGIVVLKQSEARGEMVFLDPMKKKILSVDGVKNFPALIKVIKLDSGLHNRNITMSKEQLLSFLSMSSGYLDPEGQSVATRQLLHTLSLQCMGLIHPSESFKPRGDASL